MQTDKLFGMDATLSRRSMIKAIGAALIAGSTPTFVPALIDPISVYADHSIYEPYLGAILDYHGIVVKEKERKLVERRALVITAEDTNDVARWLESLKAGIEYRAATSALAI